MMTLNDLTTMFNSDDDQAILSAASCIVELCKIEGFECKIESPRKLLRARQAIDAIEQSLARLPTQESMSLQASAQLFAQRIGPLPALKRLHIKELIPELCPALIGFIDAMPNLVRITLDRPVSLELWEEIQRAPRLIQLQ